jgi:hypothetical protein
MTGVPLEFTAAKAGAERAQELRPSKGIALKLHGERRWGGTAFSKLRFFGVVGAKLRAKVLPGGRAPDFHVTIAGAERLAAEDAAARTAVHEIPAAREHRNLSSQFGVSQSCVAIR